ncbi:hypothetical protein EVAR_55820_1 [Eumeta japonica]|uniref:Mos1 transposase HTH domain-containing protein n=1 Tax=Eumeta variegata TaxID=151549 RepID=A0A4C1Z8Y1_EUMVA|nr:hypothetical protein EVAR_55820_1 [Eumeta japonica]
MSDERRAATAAHACALLDSLIAHARAPAPQKPATSARRRPLLSLLGHNPFANKKVITDFGWAFNYEVPSIATVYNWFNEFKRDLANLTDDLHDGRPSTAKTEDRINTVRLIIETDKGVTYQLTND